MPILDSLTAVPSIVFCSSESLTNVLANWKCTAVFLYSGKATTVTEQNAKTFVIMGTKILSGRRVREILYEMAKSISDSDEFVSELSKSNQEFNLSVGIIAGDVVVRAIRKEVGV